MIQGLTEEQIAYLQKLVPDRAEFDDASIHTINQVMRTFRKYNRSHPEKLVTPYTLN
jgi:hypothetical protein